jgi:hypothetical protein
VVSIFEDFSSGPSPRYQTRDPVAAAVAGGAGGGAARGATAQSAAAAQPAPAAATQAGSAAAAVARLRAQLLREVPAHVGVGAEYGRVAQRFGADALLAARRRVVEAARAQRERQQQEREARVAGAGQQPRRRRRQQEAGEGQGPAQQLQQQQQAQPGPPQRPAAPGPGLPHEQSLVVGDGAGWGAAEFAALGGLLQARQLDLRELDLTGAPAGRGGGALGDAMV